MFVERKREISIQSGIAGVLIESPALYELTVEPAVAETWGLLVGDILTNLRAALDHLAWSLAAELAKERAEPLTPDDERGVYFPLKVVPAKKSAVGGLTADDLRLFPEASHHIVERFQPYNRAKLPDVKYLGVLNDLVGRDKHRLVTPVLRDTTVRLGVSEELVRLRSAETQRLQFLATGLHNGPFEPKATFELVLPVPFLFPEYFRLDEFRLMHRLVQDDAITAFQSYFAARS